jgi:tetratricopeptide (TPR) repeat protein
MPSVSLLPRVTSAIGRPSLRWIGVTLLGCSVLLMHACAPKAPPVAPGAPRYPEFVFPAVPPDLAKSAQVRAHDAAWRLLQAGDAKAAARAFEQISRKDRGFYPADAGLGWSALAAKDGKQAVAAFDRALQRAPKYLPALVGRGEALLSIEDERGALAAFEAALAVQSDLPDVLRRVEVLRFRGLEQRLQAARTARDAGRFAEARAAYRRALEVSPDSALVYRELAEVDRKAGDLVAALEHARAAARVDPADPSSFVLIGEILEAQGQPAQAVEAYLEAQALDAAPEVAERIDRLRRQAALAKLPVQYRELGSAARATRGDLAALIGIRLEAVVTSAQQRQAVLLTDVRGHWAATWIDAVARAGIMQSFPNHTFQPRNGVRRGDLAVAASRLLALIGNRDRTLADTWTGKRLAFPDLGMGHARHPAASVAVASGVMTRLPGDAFGVSAPVSGAEAIETVDRVAVLAARAGFEIRKGASR